MCFVSPTALSLTVLSSPFSRENHRLGFLVPSALFFIPSPPPSGRIRPRCPFLSLLRLYSCISVLLSLPTANMKSKVSGSSFEVDADDLYIQQKVKVINRIDSARIGATLLALLMGLTILGVSADALNVYNTTNVSADFFLPLWPQDFDLRPTVALVAGAVFVTATNVVSLLCSRVKVVSHLDEPSGVVGGQKFNLSADTFASPSQLRSRTPVHTSVTFVAPFVGLIAALVAMILFYAVNASQTTDTLLSWTCRWKALSMAQKPQFGALCKESWAGVYLSILLIPVECAALLLATWQMRVEKHASAYSRARKTSSPVQEMVTESE